MTKHILSVEKMKPTLIVNPISLTTSFSQNSNMMVVFACNLWARLFDNWTQPLKKRGRLPDPVPDTRQN